MFAKNVNLKYKLLPLNLVNTRLPGAEPQPIWTILFLDCIEIGCYESLQIKLFWLSFILNFFVLFYFEFILVVFHFEFVLVIFYLNLFIFNFFFFGRLPFDFFWLLSILNFLIFFHFEFFLVVFSTGWPTSWSTHPPWVTNLFSLRFEHFLKMEDDQNGSRPKLEDDQIGRQPKWKLN